MTNKSGAREKDNTATEAVDHQQEQLVSRILWILVVLYVAILLLSPPGQLLPGEPIWAVKPETVSEIAKESLNFFFILPILSFLAVPFLNISAPVIHPASEAFFNFAEAWILMFLPLMLLDRRGQSLPRVVLWSAAMFLTNVFLIPYMAQRLSQPVSVEAPKKGRLARVFGLIGLVVGTGAIAWFCLARPEFGGLTERWDYFVEKVGSDRVTLAFCVDLALFWLFQIWLMDAVIEKENKQRFLRFVPFWGLSTWLIT